MSDRQTARETNERKLAVFLDTNVIINYQRGKLKWLFEPDALRNFRYAINPIVLQEILLRGDPGRQEKTLKKIEQNVKVLPLETGKSEEFLSKARELRNWMVHSNDILILSSAKECEYFVTDDRHLLEKWDSNRPKMLSTEGLKELLQTRVEV